MEKIESIEDMNKTFFSLSKEEVISCSKKISDLSILDLQEKFGVIPSFSTQGGLAIPYTNLGLPNFGEWLHLRFNKGFDENFGEKWSLYFAFNTYKRRATWTNEEENKIIIGANKLLFAMQEILKISKKVKS